eukprot:TRINITY_DN43411_c0_g2_i1.p2 TRINITY_DN43411_c0_g2~~TRINITY_DN43411_c0_g2_i1.p2  ORF type:complete len:402 (+),score=78.96 TRINITY_DN43411_c0_g2_i1:65-1207(+)
MSVRPDPSSGALLTLAQFSAKYAQPGEAMRQWSAAELRVDPTDGRFYTRAEFVGAYGQLCGVRRWIEADPDLQASERAAEKAEANRLRYIADQRAAKEVVATDALTQTGEDAIADRVEQALRLVNPPTGASENSRRLSALHGSMLAGKPSWVMEKASRSCVGMQPGDKDVLMAALYQGQLQSGLAMPASREGRRVREELRLGVGPSTLATAAHARELARVAAHQQHIADAGWRSGDAVLAELQRRAKKGLPAGTPVSSSVAQDTMRWWILTAPYAHRAPWKLAVRSAKYHCNLSDRWLVLQEERCSLPYSDLVGIALNSTKQEDGSIALLPVEVTRAEQAVETFRQRNKERAPDADTERARKGGRKRPREAAAAAPAASS